MDALQPHPVELSGSFSERAAYAAGILATLAREDAEEEERQRRIAELLRQTPDHAYLLWPPAASPTPTREQLEDVVRAIVELTEHSIVNLRTDIAIAATDPSAPHPDLVASIADRTDALLRINALRPRAIKRAPLLGELWTEAVYRRTQIVADYSIKIAAAIRDGRIGKRTELESQLEMVRLLPVAFGSTRLTPEEVVQFCAREKILLEICQAAQIAKSAFPNAKRLRLEIDGDPEGTEEWVYMQIDVPDDRPLERFNAFLGAVNRQIPVDRANKFELSYNVR